MDKQAEGLLGCIAVPAVIGFFLYAVWPSQSTREASQQAGQDQRIILIVQDEIRARLRDPDSAVFTSVRVSRKAGVPAVCGSVNSRNGFGGMAGPERFIGGGMTALESDFAPGEFEQSWRQLC